MTPLGKRARQLGLVAAGLAAAFALATRNGPLGAAQALSDAASSPATNAPRAAASAALPERLSETGLYLPGSTDAIDPRNLGYVPQYPLWSDGAVKKRWVRLPEGARIDAANPDEWQFPAGTRFWKELGFERRVETRYIERLADGSWAYATYVWNAAGTDAERAPERGLRSVYSLRAGVSHDVPGVGDCKACHEGRPGRVLGFNALQLSGDTDPGAPHREPAPASALRLAELEARGLLANVPAELSSVQPRIVARTATERAALGYLFGNCSNCHNARGPLAELGLDFDISLRAGEPSPALATSVGKRSRYVFPGAARSLRVAPGQPGDSTLALRMKSRSPAEQMPPLGSRITDGEAIALIERWISEEL